MLSKTISDINTQGATKRAMKLVHGDAIDATVRWGEGARLTQAEPIRIRIEFRDTDVYAFRFSGPALRHLAKATCGV